MVGGWFVTSLLRVCCWFVCDLLVVAYICIAITIIVNIVVIIVYFVTIMSNTRPFGSSSSPVPHSHSSMHNVRYRLSGAAPVAEQPLQGRVPPRETSTPYRPGSVPGQGRMHGHLARRRTRRSARGTVAHRFSPCSPSPVLILMLISICSRKLV